jgi:uncharacterized protein YcfL
MKKIVCIFIMILFITGCNSKDENITNPLVNSSEGVINEQIVSNYSLKPISLIYENGVSTLSLSITNQMDIDRNINKIVINYYLENGTLVTSLTDNSSYTVESNSSIYLTFESDLDLTNVATIEYQISE